ncbi:hypothetical protein [Bacillus sp. 179-C3.3 HS]|uniref:hypothetical protein n=1 Tax=Bacillus sp. 179-C3.3 HS TaxID=3232162 RepID=UPI00399F21F0
MEKVEQLFKKWVNHSKEGYCRSDLNKTDVNWKDLIQQLHVWENSEDNTAKEFAKYLLYTGELRRVHKDHKKINYHNHYVSWTLAEDLEDIYWFKEESSSPYTIITAKATKDNPGINIKGFIEAMKSEIPDYELISVNIYKEQEVIFPLQKNSTINVEKFN